MCVCVCVCVRARNTVGSLANTHKKEESIYDDNQCLYSSEDLVEDWLKLVSHLDATISRLVGDKGLRYKCDF